MSYTARGIFRLYFNSGGAILWPGLPSVVEPGGGDVSVPEPLLHLRVQGQVAELLAFAVHPQVQYPTPLVDVANFQHAKLLAPQSVVEQHREDGTIPLAVLSSVLLSYRQRGTFRGYLMGV